MKLPCKVGIIVFLPVFSCHSAECGFFLELKSGSKSEKWVTRDIICNKPQFHRIISPNGIEVANSYFVSKVHDYLIQIEVLLSAKGLFPFKYHNFCSFTINFQSKKGLSMPMPIFKATAGGPGAFDVFLTSS